jgi:hypothetical protein
VSAARGRNSSAITNRQKFLRSRCDVGWVVHEHMSWLCWT